MPGPSILNNLTSVIVLLATIAVASYAQQKKTTADTEASSTALETTEVFYTSRIGKTFAAENRELLKELYNSVAAEYDKEIEAQRAKQIEAFEGTKVRILKVLDEVDDNGQLYLCAYEGGPKVISIAGEIYKVGQLTPALKISEAGEHTVEITRTILEKGSNQRGPKLENDGVVTFFGIPLVIDDKPVKARDAPPSTPNKPKPKTPKRHEITEEKTLSKFNATVSTEKLEEGPALMSTDLFLEQIKNGNYYTVVRTEDRKCELCIGFGRVTDTFRPAGMREPDGKIDCPDCKGAGKNAWNVTYRVAW
ncbi:MAG: hypothetical protein AAGD22_03260 [Verrucomicrobiota bacterium]